MPGGRPRRTPSRGRPPKRGATTSRSQSASRKARSPQKKKSPPKSTPKPRSISRSRKPSTAPAAVKRPSSPKRPESRTTTSRMTTTTTRVAAPHMSVTVSSSHVPRGSASPPQLRSRTLGAALAQAVPQKSPVAAKQRQTWRQTISRQFDKLGRSVRKIPGPRALAKSASKHLRANWKYWLLAFAVLLLAGLTYKFQRELLVNVQQINKQVVEFVQQQYEQQRKIFGEYWLKTQEALEQARQNYLTQQQTTQSPETQNPLPTSPPKPSRSPHLTD